MSRFKITTYVEPEDSEIEEWYLVEALNPEDSNHFCLGHFEGIWGGRQDLIQHLEKYYQVGESELMFVDNLD